MLRFDRYSCIWLLAILSFVSTSPLGASGDTICAAADYIEINTTLRARGEAGVERNCFDTYLPSPGFWMLEADVPNSAGVEPRLEFFGQRCAGGADDHSFRYWEQHASRLMLETHEGGNYQFCVSAQDPAKVLGNYSLTNTFVPGLKSDDPDEDEPEPDPFAHGVLSFQKSDDPDEDEPEPDPFADGVLSVVHKSDDPDEDEPEPDPFAGGVGAILSFQKSDDPDEDEPEPDPLVQTVLLKRACQDSLRDDHSETLQCATPIALGREIRAEIRNDLGDDTDVFTFNVGELKSVQLATYGSSDVLGGLYDENGYRLAVDDDGGDGANFRIVKSLSRGRYFVRVEGTAGAEGRYSLTVHELVSE